jgi:xanthine dehydrogenase accessory factor
VKDKRPAVIAALAAAEVMAAALNFRQPVQVDISRRPAAAKLVR